MQDARGCVCVCVCPPPSCIPSVVLLTAAKTAATSVASRKVCATEERGSRLSGGAGLDEILTS